MPGDSLPRQRYGMLLEKARAYLKQALIVPLSQLIQDQKPCVVAERAEQCAKGRIERNAHASLCNKNVACKQARARFGRRRSVPAPRQARTVSRNLKARNGEELPL